MAALIAMRERERVGALGTSKWRREKKGGSGRGRCMAGCQLRHAAIGRQLDGGGAESRTG
jgi:hypothetical protein